MLHFDDSSEDTWAVKWFLDPACKVSYNRLYLDNGTVVQITPSMRHVAWHAGVCTIATPNTRYYGISAATNAKVPVTAAQFASIVHDCVALFEDNKWPRVDAYLPSTWRPGQDARIIGHEDVACFASGKLGRKIDPSGYDHKHPILDMAAVREAVYRQL